MTRSSAPRPPAWPGAITAIALTAGALVAAPASPASAAPAASATENRPTYLGKSLYTGEFHAHTGMSDGAENPSAAFTYVRDKTDADFFALTEHDVMWDIRNGDDFIKDWRDADSDEWRALHELADKFNASQTELTVAPAIENTWYDGTGHINLFNTSWHATARATEKGTVDGFANGFGVGDMKYDYFTYLARLKQDPNAIGQFNHPSPTGKGEFFGFKGLDRTADERMELIEVKSPDQAREFQKALDAGWHLSPVWNGDEHSATWVTSNPSITGIWARGRSLDDLYAAMRDRSTYSTGDVNAVLAFGGNGKLMGSILPAGTTTLDAELQLRDPDAKDSFTGAQLITNGGKVAHDFGRLSGNDLTLKKKLDVKNGDFYYVRADQADGNFLVSAPIWIGETTSGANYAPQITVADVPATARYGQAVTLPQVSATDDSGGQPTTALEVWDSAGQVPVKDGAFQIRSYDDTFVVVKATDDKGNTNAELRRIQIDQRTQDPAGVFRFTNNVAVGAEPGTAGIAVTTDRDIQRVYAQVLPEGGDDWSRAQVLTSTGDSPYETSTVGNDEPKFQHSVTGQTLRSHEFRLTGLKVGASYRYRLGVTRNGAAPKAADTAAWTDVKGRFLAGGTDSEPVYILGDVQVPDSNADSLKLPGKVLDQLKAKAPGGGTVMQLGDLVEDGGRTRMWSEINDALLSGLDTQYAAVKGNHETYEDPDYNSVAVEPASVFTNMFALPKNGAVGEANYSFDRGQIHFSVLSSTARLDDQLAWLVKDVRASDKKWNVALGHFSYYGGRHGADAGMDIDREKVTRVLDQLGVDMYIGAHDHVYKRSTIYEGRLAKTPEETAEGTTFVTMGSSGPKFYENAKHWWDDKVDDEDVQMGGVLTATDAGLRLTAYKIDGRVVDDFTVTKPQGTWKVSSAEIRNRELDGVGLISSPGSLDRLTVMAATYDASQQKMIDVRSADVTLNHTGREQYISFDKPLAVAPSSTVRLFVWDSLKSGKPLRPAVTLREGLAGDGTAQTPYLIDSADDLAKIDNDPAGHYRLAGDLNLSGLGRSQIGRTIAFTGVFDGAGHTVSGLSAIPGQGPGLFADNHGTIVNLVVNGEATTDRTPAGLVADINHGTIERVRADGSLTAASYVGGITGHQFGIVRDSVSTVNVKAAAQYVGGVVGVAMGGSVTQNVLATGSVTSAGASAGGIAAYGYDATEISHSVALNSNVSGTSYAHAILGRVLAGQTASLEDNHVSRAVPISGQTLTDPPAAGNQRGNVVPPAELRKQSFYEARGWDFTNVWQWNETGARPTLKVAPETLQAGEAPQLPKDDRGFHIVKSADDLAQIGTHLSYDYVLGADIDLSGKPFTTLPGAFTGELDGAGHTIKGLTSTGGLFTQVSGNVHDLAIVGAKVTGTTARAGILAGASTGTVERVWVSGSVTGASRVGGLLGDSQGVVRDVYSTADVHALSTEAGGVIGVALAGSLTERAFATGAVLADGRNDGGVAGYGYTGTTIRNSIALNPTVTAPSWAHRFLGRVLANNVATLEGNWAVETLQATTQQETTIGPATLNGATATRDEARSQDFWTGKLGFDLTTVWKWDEDGRRPVLRAVPEDVPAVSEPEPTGPALARDTDGFYLVRQAADLGQIAAHPAERFRLAADLDLTGVAPITPAFTGELDGAGHTLSGYTSSVGGLFTSVTGKVHDLTLAGASVNATTGNVGPLADRLDGTVERVATSGSIVGATTVGGIVGYSCGVLRDSWSATTVSTTGGKYAGGLVGIAGGAAQCSASGGSLTERNYATGAVTVPKSEAAAGISGYAYTGTTIRNNVALNPTVTATGWAHRIVARTLNGGAPTVEHNLAVETLVASVQSIGSTALESFNGTTVTVAQAADPATYASIGWDLEKVWRWDTGLGRPVLRAALTAPATAPEPASPAAENPATEETATPAAAASAESAASARTVAFTTVVPAAAAKATETDGIRHQAVVNDNGTVTVTVSAGAATAAKQLSFLLLKAGAPASAPAGGDIAYLGEARLDEQGNATLTVLLNQPDGTTLALNTSGDTKRYVAPLLSRVPEPTGMRVLHDTVTATVKTQGNAPAQVTITLICTGKGKCQEDVTVSHGGRPVDDKKVTLQPGKTRDLKLNLRDEARAALRAGKSIVLDVRIGTAPAVQVKVNP
ncbi:metallophosphoesterase [Streptosporangium sp. NPDC000239]|uniref:metallophosphoesterase n=1 Tax=Streptosporangium sp. NPDC000239 TaxID=3154248 RepID=UPI003321DFFB